MQRAEMSRTVVHEKTPLNVFLSVNKRFGFSGILWKIMVHFSDSNLPKEMCCELISSAKNRVSRLEIKSSDIFQIHARLELLSLCQTNALDEILTAIWVEANTLEMVTWTLPTTCQPTLWLISKPRSYKESRFSRLFSDVARRLHAIDFGTH